MILININNECTTGNVPYVIRKGDTLSSIARQYNTTVQDIINANQNINPNNLIINKTICVPLRVQLYPSCPTTNYYVVRNGDTFESIANYFNVSYAQLYYSNYGIDPNLLYEDQILCIPISQPPVNILINLNDRILNIRKNDSIVKSYIISKENPNFPIPRGKFIILYKKVDPGVEFGARWLGLSEAGLGIHGTNTPQFIEAVSTEKSIIMSNQDISDLFNLVTVGTEVNII